MWSDTRDTCEPGADAKSMLVGLGKLLIQPPALAFVILGLTIGLWLPPVVYLLLLTLQVGAGPAIIWGLLLVALAVALAGASYFAVGAIRLLPFAGEVKLAKSYGHQPTIDLKVDAWRIRRRALKLWPLWTGALMLYLALPAGVALSNYGSAPKFVVQDGKLRATTPDEQTSLLLDQVRRHTFASAPTADRSR